MQMHRKKRIEIIIEAPLLRSVISRLERHRVKGYSVLPVLAGLGHEGRWESSGLVGDAGRMVALICIVDPAECEGVTKDIHALLASQIGIVSVADVEVIRSEHF
jgi:PII-like signaling protein